MTGRGRGGRFGSGRGWGSRGGSGVGGGGGAVNGMVCACEANTPLLLELRHFDEECLRTGKVKLRHGLKRAMRSLERYPLPVTTEKEACALEGVGSFTARRMLRGLSQSAPAPGGSSAATSDSNSNSNSNSHRTDQYEENIEPPSSSSAAASAPGRGRDRKPSSNSNSTRGSSSATASGCCSSSSSNNNAGSMLRMNLRPDGVGHGHSDGRGAEKNHGRPLSLASNFAALRGDVGDAGGGGDGTETPDVTPKRPTSRARREEVGDGTAGVASGLSFSSKAPRFFSGDDWEACVVVDNREHDVMSMQSTLLQKGVRCETRQLPLGDMLWIARRRDDPTSEVLLGYIVERKTASDLASSIVDGRYDEQKRRLKLSGLRRCIYLVEGHLNHQSQLAPSTLRTALASSQAVSGLTVVQCDGLRDSVDFLARTHRHVASLLSRACRSSSLAGGGEGGRWPGSSSDGGGAGGGGGVLLRPAMTYGEYAQGCAKRAGTTTARRVLGAMMRQVPGCSAARAEALVRAFQSPLGLMLALERAAEGEGEGAAGGRGGVGVGGGDHAARMKRVDEVLAGLVCRGKGGASTNKLPQPMRRLLCRLIVGETVFQSAGGGDGDRYDGAEGDVEVEVQARAQRAVVEGVYAGLSGGHGDADPCGGWDVEPMNMTEDGDPYFY